MRRVTLDQRSPEWLLWRQRGIGGSDAPVLVNGLHFGRTPLTLWQEKVGLVDREGSGAGREPGAQWAMREGARREDEVRSWYESLMGVTAAPLCAVHAEHDFVKASLDGWIEDEEIVLEIKYANKAYHQGSLEGEVPHAYVPQLQHLCLVTGSPLCHYISFNPRFPAGERYALVQYQPTPQELEELLAIERRFWGHVLDLTPPPENLR